MEIKKKMKVIPQSMLDTLTEAGYFKHFNFIVQNYNNEQSAWEAMEITREHYGLQRRFSTFESFRTSKFNFVKKQQNSSKKATPAKKTTKATKKAPVKKKSPANRRKNTKK